MIGRFLSRHKHGLAWLHIAAVVGAVCVVIPMIAQTGDPFTAPWRAMVVFVVATVAFSQNIGLMHHCAHHLPAGSRWLGRGMAHLLHGLGGLAFSRTRFTHRLHHAHLGTALDPDRIGYESTTTLGRRLRYLLLIGPLRARYAPVDRAPALEAMSTKHRTEHLRRWRRERNLIVVIHLVLMALCGWYYPVVFAALLFANVLSNAREMAEHGNHGRAAYVDVRVSPIGVLLFSTPGFWFHGTHHMDANLHYLDLPLASAGVARKNNLPDLRRNGTLAYLFTGQ